MSIVLFVPCGDRAQCNGVGCTGASKERTRSRADKSMPFRVHHCWEQNGHTYDSVNYSSAGLRSVTRLQIYLLSTFLEDYDQDLP